MGMQTDFDLQDFLPYQVNRAAEALSRDFQDHYRMTYGMLRTEWRVIFHLGRYGSMTAKEICDRASLHKTKVSRAVRALQDKRYLVRREDEADRRHEILTLTRLGQEVFRDLHDKARAYDRAISKRFSRSDEEVLRRCLKVLQRM